MAKKKRIKLHPYIARSEMGGNSYYSEEYDDVDFVDADIMLWQRCPDISPEGYEWARMKPAQRIRMCHLKLSNAIDVLGDMIADGRMVDVEALQVLLERLIDADNVVK